MPEDDDLRFVPAEYRVRLFLSVDLSGSTAYKNSIAGEDRSNDSAPKWVTVFQQFYADFPALYGSEYQKQTNASVGTDGCPKLWKAVGDELVFCGTISNQKACIVALNAFISTLIHYRKRLLDEGIDLNVKGAGWLAAFPEPNRTVQLRPNTGEPEYISASEALEAAADHAPFDYDFLGKAIDTGFRIAKNSKPERLVLSVQLARLLTSADPQHGFAHTVWLERPSILKGVNGNEPYPLLFIDTLKHISTEKARNLEREILGENHAPNPAKLNEYLVAYCSVVGTDEIMLKVDAESGNIDAPESYTKHKELIATHLLSEQGREFDGENGDQQNEADEANSELPLEAVDLNPLQPGDS